jgi:protein involved in polysaccharide export with SLBB domain
MQNSIRVRRSCRRLIVVAAGLIASSSFVFPVRAQMPTPEQIEIFQNLPPDQQQAILEAIGRSGATGLPTTIGAQRPEQRGTTTQPAETRAARREAEARERLSPEARLEPDDTLMVEILPLEWKGQERVLTARPVGTVSPLIPGVTTSQPTLPSIPQPGPATEQRPADAELITRTDAETEQLERVMDAVRRGNPYRITRAGALEIPGLPPVQVGGLNVYEVTQRLTVERLLRDFRIRVTRLPLEPALKPFGYDLFTGAPTTFASATDLPVPADYVVGPGDRLEIQLVGNTKARHSLVVNRDGNIMFPELGPIAVSGMRFEDARTRIQSRVADQMIGTTASVSMVDLRSIRVLVVGEAVQPGSYAIGGLAAVTNALVVSGGVKPIGSLRNIQLKRNGTLVKRLDLYDLLLNGDASNDARLQNGDVIFVPPVGPTVGVSGEVRRPAIYELKGERTIADVVRLAGGLTPEADPALTRLERIDQRRERVMVDVDLSSAAGSAVQVQSGDVVRVERVKATYANSIDIDGHVQRPASVQYRAGIRLTDVIPSVAELKPNADLRYVLIRREQIGTRRIEVVSADLQAAWRAPRSDADPLLAPRDRIVVFDREAGRQAMLAPILDELRMQSISGEPTQVVRVSGKVNAPGDYPLEPGMTVDDLVRAGGGLAEDAYGGEADLARYEVRDGQTRQTQVLSIDLSRALAGDTAANLPLAPFDLLVVKEISQWSGSQETVRLEGEVKFPGEYPIERGETLRSVVTRAGGLTPLAFPEGSVFTRETLRERERRQLDILADRLQQDLGTIALQGAQAGGLGAPQASETLAIGQSLLTGLRSSKPVGRLVIDLDRVLSGSGPEADVLLKGGDALIVPRESQEVTVIGEVQNATSHLFDPSLSRDDYLRLSGGTTPRADDKRIYIVRANGSVEGASGGSWFGRSGNVHPGDTIVVPLNAERMRPLPMWTAITTIIYNLAVAVAAIGSL